MSRNLNIYTGIDVGTESVKAVIANVLEDFTLEILGFAEAPTHKIIKGEIRNTSIVFEQCMQALSRACRMAGYETPPGHIVAVLSGSHLKTGIASHTINFPEVQQVTAENVEMLMHESYNAIPEVTVDGLETLNIAPTNRCFHLDDRHYVINPIGQSTKSFTEEIRYLAGESYINEQFGTIISKLLNNRPCASIYAPIAIASAVTNPQDTSDLQSYSDIKGMVIEFGAGMISLSMPTSYGYMVCEQIALGCDHIANDLDIGLDLQNIATARQIVRDMDKLRLNAIATHDGYYRTVAIAQSGECPERLLPADAVETIIEARLDEIFDIIAKRLKVENALPYLGNSIMLSGGGALIPGITEIAQRKLKRPVHIAYAYDITDATTIFKQDTRYNMVLGAIRSAERDKRIRDEKQGKPLFETIRDFFRSVFND